VLILSMHSEDVHGSRVLRALDADHLREFAHPTSWWRTA
jgi:hypothetical protein